MGSLNLWNASLVQPAVEATRSAKWFAPGPPDARGSCPDLQPSASRPPRRIKQARTLTPDHTAVVLCESLESVETADLKLLRAVLERLAEEESIT